MRRDPLGASGQSPPARRARDPGAPGESQARPALGAPDGRAPCIRSLVRATRGRTHGVSVPAQGPVHRATESSATSRWRTGSCIWWPSWIGTRAASWPGGCRTPSSDRLVEALEDALTRYGPPEIFNTDQGAQFTSQAFTTVLKTHAVAISMDGKSCWVDNVFVERLWRSVKYEDVYLHAYDTPAALRAGLRLFSVLQRATAS